MKNVTTLIYSALFSIGAAVSLSAQDADPVQAAAAKVFAQQQDRTVQLSVTRKLKGKDSTFEVPAVSLDGKGLFATSLSGLESSGPKNLGAMMLGAGADEGEGADDEKPDKGELSRVALLHADATEAEGDLVITDAALDLALIRIRGTEGKDPVVPAAPTAAKAAPVLLDNVIAIERKGADFQRIASAALLQIAALVTTPRNLYVCAAPLEGGTAVYNLAGELLGVATDIHNESVIVPTAAILKLAAKVPAKTDQ